MQPMYCLILMLTKASDQKYLNKSAVHCSSSVAFVVVVHVTACACNKSNQFFGLVIVDRDIEGCVIQH